MCTKPALTSWTISITMAVLLVGCGADGPDAANAPADDTIDAREADGDESQPAESVAAAIDPVVEANGIVVDVLARDNSFLPEEIEISAGTEIRWENRGRNDHNVLPADGTFDWGVEVEGFAPGDVYSAVFATPGTYPYYCSLHGTSDFGMIGTIVVTE